MNRRDFFANGTVFLGLAGARRQIQLLLGGERTADQPAKRRLEPLSEHVSVYRDAVSVGVIQKNRKTLLIDSGEAMILDDAKALGIGMIDRCSTHTITATSVREPRACARRA